PPEMPPRDVRVHGLELLDWSWERARLRLLVSKGYYVRALARDLGDGLGVPAHLSSLRRTQSGAFRIEDACPYPPPPEARWISVAEAVRRSLPTRELTAEGALRFGQGKAIRPEDQLLGQDLHLDTTEDQAEDQLPDEPTWGAFHQERFLGLLEPTELPNHFKVKRGFAETPADEPEV
ncbi:MAG TPA: hypothetical protein VLC09_09825, partial [Polyangiaceae bacterium]|nr:hypothetical protein [Polyangiaceae bacterium]